jgi:hypothetical protein
VASLSSGEGEGKKAAVGGSVESNFAELAGEISGIQRFEWMGGWSEERPCNTLATLFGHS